MIEGHEFENSRQFSVFSLGLDSYFFFGRISAAIPRVRLGSRNRANRFIFFACAITSFTTQQQKNSSKFTLFCKKGYRSCPLRMP
jgi:hypothetical protein